MAFETMFDDHKSNEAKIAANVRSALETLKLHLKPRASQCSMRRA